MDGNEFLLPHSLPKCQQQLCQCQKELRNLQKSAQFHRRAELHQALQRAKVSKNYVKVKALRNILYAEQKQQFFKRLKWLRNPNTVSLTTINIPSIPTTNYKACKDWISIVTPKEIENHLIARNKTHFGQAHGTFLTVPPFTKWGDWAAQTHDSDLILEGDFTSAQISNLQQLFIQHMEKQTELDTIRNVITEDKWIGKISTWPESTSTSPSGFHLTHSKALVNGRACSQDDLDSQQLNEQQKKLINWQVHFLNLAITKKFIYSRWCKIVNVMIQKDPDNVKKHRLRVLHLYDHDYNLLLAVKWCQLLQHCTKYQLIHEGQYGGVPGRDSITPTIIKELQY